MSCCTKEELENIFKEINEAMEIANNYSVPEGGESGQACADIAEILSAIIEKLTEKQEGTK